MFVEKLDSRSEAPRPPDLGLWEGGGGEAQRAFYKLDAMIGAARLYCRMHGSIFRIDTIILWHSRVFFDPKDTDSTGAFYGGT